MRRVVLLLFLLFQFPITTQLPFSSECSSRLNSSVPCFLTRLTLNCTTFPYPWVKLSDLSEFAMADSGSRYYFNNVGTVRDLVYPNKAILNFKLNGKDERAILLAKMLTLDGKTPDDHKSLDHFLKTGDVIHFDCHIYDKGGGVGSGKDKYVIVNIVIVVIVVRNFGYQSI